MSAIPSPAVRPMSADSCPVRSEPGEQTLRALAELVDIDDLADTIRASMSADHRQTGHEFTRACMALNTLLDALSESRAALAANDWMPDILNMVHERLAAYLGEEDMKACPPMMYDDAITQIAHRAAFGKLPEEMYPDGSLLHRLKAAEAEAESLRAALEYANNRVTTCEAVAWEYEAQNDQLSAALTTQQAEAQTARIEATELRAALREAQEDTRRLDWWFSNGLDDSVCEGSVDLWWADDAAEQTRVTHGGSVRDALDKAMRGEFEPDTTPQEK